MESGELLLILDELVKAGGPSGFKGSICLGVQKSKEDTQYWHAKLGLDVQTGFSQEPLRDTDVFFLMGEDVAEAIINFQTLPEDPEVLELIGDRRLLDRFLERYLTERSMLDIRAGNSKTKKR